MCLRGAVAAWVLLSAASAALSQSPSTAPATRPAGGDNERLAAARQRALQQRLEQELIAAWHLRIRGIVQQSLSSDRPEQQEEGRRRIAAIRDSLALGPMIRILGAAESPTLRQTLAEHLGRLPDELATCQLTVMCLTDPDSTVRATAAGRLALRGDPRAMAVLTAALDSSHPAFVDFAAQALGVIGRDEAIDPLIDALVAPERTEQQEREARRRFLRRWRRTWRWPVRPQLAPGAAHPRESGLADEADWLQPVNHTEPAPPEIEPARYRTDALLALRSLTGADFGFDPEAWRRWWAGQRVRRRPLPRAGGSVQY